MSSNNTLCHEISLFEGLNNVESLCVYIHNCSVLPVGYKEKVMTAEAIQKAALKSQKRKQLADEKREKDKVI